MCLKKQLLDDPETSAQGLGRGFGQPVYPSEDKSVLDCTQVSVYFQSPEGPKRKSQIISFGFTGHHKLRRQWPLA